MSLLITFNSVIWHSTIHNSQLTRPRTLWKYKYTVWNILLLVDKKNKLGRKSRKKCFCFFFSYFLTVIILLSGPFDLTSTAVDITIFVFNYFYVKCIAVFDRTFFFTPLLYCLPFSNCIINFIFIMFLLKRGSIRHIMELNGQYKYYTRQRIKDLFFKKNLFSPFKIKHILKFVLLIMHSQYQFFIYYISDNILLSNLRKSHFCN